MILPGHTPAPTPPRTLALTTTDWPRPAPVRRRTMDGCEVRELDEGTFLMRRGTVTLRVPPTVLERLFEAAAL